MNLSRARIRRGLVPCLSVSAAVLITVVLGFGGSAAASATDSGPRRVHGTLLLTGAEHWQAESSRTCVGSGLYADVGARTRVVVRNGDGKVLARTILGRGRVASGGCRWAFTVALPPADLYRFKIGPNGSVFQTAYDDAGLTFQHGRVEFSV